MPQLQPIEQFEFGGVDSRSNPLNMPSNRSLYCRNWCPRPDGHLQLRHGYAQLPMSVVVPGTIHTLIPYQSWDSTKKYLLFFQTTGITVHDLASGIDSIPTIKGDPIDSATPWGYYPANNRIHIGNGFDQKFFDGSVLRDNGLRAPTEPEVADVVISDGARELTSVEAAAVGLAEAAGGAFSNTTRGGYLVYVLLFDPTVNELGPATISVGSGRIAITGGSGRQINITSLPVTTGYLKLIARTNDGASTAYLQYDITVLITSCTRVGNILTVNAVAHGLTTGDAAILTGTTNFDGVYAATVIDFDHYTVILATAAGADTTGGASRRILQAAAASTTAVIIDPGKLNTDYVANQSLGLAAAAAESQPGYQFYGAIYNRTTGHVGNRIAMGGRYAPTVRCNARITGLPDYSGIDSEWELLIGRTGDGALVPYAVIDNGGNFISTPSGDTTITINESDIDGNYELPTRNGIIPAETTMFARVGTRSYAADPSTPTVRASGDESDFTQGKFLGRPEQSWAANDIDTFPTAEPICGIAEVDYELFVGTKNDTAIFTDMNGQFVWRGPWNVGLAGPRAMTKAMPYGFFWVSGDRQLCTFVAGVPTPVSDEYQLAELARIGDAYLAFTEVRYFRDPVKDKDELRIEARDSTGTAFTVIHDFKLRDGRSETGQGYTAAFSGPLAVVFKSVEGRDANGARQIFAAATDGRLYQLYDVGDDNGAAFDADTIYLIECGTGRRDVSAFDWFGDENVQVSVGRTLASVTGAGPDAFDSLGDGSAVQEEESDSRWRVDNPVPETKSHLYLRLQLTSHAADGDLSLNSPPHVPLETYGRIYEVVPVLGEGREL